MSRPGSGGVASGEQANIQRRERLRQLALETIDIKSDPYILKNHLGTFECKLCLTLHATETSYMIHSQAKRHQQNLAKRAARHSKEQGTAHVRSEVKKIQPKKFVSIGRPGYKAAKVRDPETGKLGLLVQIHYPKIAKDTQPRHRFMSAFEQKKEPADPKFQYLLFAAEPYDTISFKIPNMKIDKTEGAFFTHWDSDQFTFSLQLQFEATSAEDAQYQQNQNQQNQQQQQQPPQPSQQQQPQRGVAPLIPQNF